MVLRGLIDPWEAKDCGKLLIRSSTRITPWALMSAGPMATTGLTLSRFGVGMRVPVTTISATTPSSFSCAKAGVLTPAKSAPHNIDDASKRPRLLRSIMDIPQDMTVLIAVVAVSPTCRFWNLFLRVTV